MDEKAVKVGLRLNKLEADLDKMDTRLLSEEIDAIIDTCTRELGKAPSTPPVKKNNGLGGAAAGAGIGMALLGPVGAIAGGFIGKMLTEDGQPETNMWKRWLERANDLKKRVQGNASSGISGCNRTISTGQGSTIPAKASGSFRTEHSPVTNVQPNTRTKPAPVRDVLPNTSNPDARASYLIAWFHEAGMAEWLINTALADPMLSQKDRPHSYSCSRHMDHVVEFCGYYVTLTYSPSGTLDYEWNLVLESIDKSPVNRYDLPAMTTAIVGWVPPGSFVSCTEAYRMEAVFNTMHFPEPARSRILKLIHDKS